MCNIFLNICVCVLLAHQVTQKPEEEEEREDNSQTNEI